MTTFVLCAHFQKNFLYLHCIKVHCITAQCFVCYCECGSVSVAVTAVS